MKAKNLRTNTVITFYWQKWTRRGCVSSCFVCVLLGQQQSAVCPQLEEDNHSIWRRNWGKFRSFISGYTGPILHTPKVTKMTFYTGKAHQFVTNFVSTMFCNACCNYMNFFAKWASTFFHILRYLKYAASSTVYMKTVAGLFSRGNST